MSNTVGLVLKFASKEGMLSWIEAMRDDEPKHVWKLAVARREGRSDRAAVPTRYVLAEREPTSPT
jgi:hypothetical protein